MARQEHFVPKRANQAWSADFVADRLVTGNKFRILTIVDVYTCEVLVFEVESHLRGEDVVRPRNRLLTTRGVPSRIFVDNSSEFSGKIFDLWVCHNKVPIDFSR